MPNNRKITKKAIKGKEGLHPGSRKAGQLTRAALRTVKLQQANKVRRGGVSSKLQRPIFFMHAIDSPSPLTLASLKAVIEVYIGRNDARIEELTAERRAGRPKTTELLDLEERRRLDMTEFETGIEVPDLTHYLTTRLLHQYIEQEVTLDHSRVDMLRLVRVFKDTEEMIVTKPGQVEKMGLGPADGTVGSDWTGEGAGRSADGDIEL